MNLIPFQTTPPSTQARHEENHNTSEQPDAIEMRVGLDLILKFAISKKKTSLSLKTINQNPEDS